MSKNYFDSTASFYGRAGSNLLGLAFAPVSSTCRYIFDKNGSGEVDGLFSLGLCAVSLLVTVPLSLMTTAALALILGCALLVTTPFMLTGAAVLDFAKSTISPSPTMV